MARPVAVDTVSAAVLPLAAVRPHPLRRFVRRYPLGAAGTFLIVAMLLLGIFANRVAPYDPVAADFGAMFIRPGPGHWFGTDAFGRDVLSRLLFGARTALVIGFASSIIGATIGAVVGVISAYFGGTTDLVLQRLVDILISFPIIILARAIGAGHWRIIFRHMFPNVGAPYLVMLTAFLGQAILLEASLSFLGLGVSEPTPAWGLMLSG